MQEYSANISRRHAGQVQVWYWNVKGLYLHPTKISFVSGVTKNGEKILDGVFAEVRQNQSVFGNSCRILKFVNRTSCCAVPLWQSLVWCGQQGPEESRHSRIQIYSNTFRTVQVITSVFRYSSRKVVSLHKRMGMPMIGLLTQKSPESISQIHFDTYTNTIWQLHKYRFTNTCSNNKRAACARDWATPRRANRYQLMLSPHPFLHLHFTMVRNSNIWRQS